MRLTLADDYSNIYIYNLRGNARTAGELRKKEAGNVFGGGARTTVAIFIGIKSPTHTGPTTIHYHDIGGYHSRDDKLRILDTTPLPDINWTSIAPNTHGDWINQRDNTFSSFPAIGARSSTHGEKRIFDVFSAGLQTNRDFWVYSYSRATLSESVTRLIDNYNAQRGRFKAYCERENVTNPGESTVTAYLDDDSSAADPTQIKWSSSLKQQLARDTRADFQRNRIVTAQYRPFDTQHVYFDPVLNHRRGRLLAMFPTVNHRNLGFTVMAPREGVEFAVLATSLIPDLSFFTYTAQFFPRYTHVEADPDDGGLDFATGEVDEYGYRRIDNITDEIHALYRAQLGDDVTRDGIFAFVYGLLHSPAYRKRYAADLKKMLPRIPTPTSRAEFDHYRDAGARLLVLHTDYETVEPYPLDVQLNPNADPDDRETWRVQKMKWRSKTDHTAIVYNPKITIAGIPAAAERYLLGSRTALGWIIDRYQVKTDKPSGIVNDPNDWCDEHNDPRYIIDLIARVTTVAVETMQIVDSLPGSLDD